MLTNPRRFVVLTVLLLAILLVSSFLVKGSLAQNNAVYYFEVNPQLQNFPVYPVSLPARDELLRGGVQFYGIDFAHPWQSAQIYAVSPSQRQAVFAPGARFSFFAQGLEPSGDVSVWEDPLAPRKHNFITSWVPGYVIGQVAKGSWYALARFRPVSARGNLEDNEVIKGYLVHLIPPGGGYLKSIDPLSGQETIIQDPVLVVVPSEVCVESSTGQLISLGRCLGQSQGINFSVLNFSQATVTPVPAPPTLRPWATYTPVPATPTPRSHGKVNGQTPPEYVDVVAGIRDLGTPDLWDFMEAKVRQYVPGLDTQSQYAVDQKVQETYLTTKRKLGGFNKLVLLFGRPIIVLGTTIRIPLFNTGILAQVPSNQVPQRPGQAPQQAVPSALTEGSWVVYDLVDEAHEIAGMYGVSQSQLDKALTVGYNSRNPSRSAAVIVHDTGTHATTAAGEHLTALGLVRSCARAAHTRMICYHFLIDTDGQIYQMQDVSKRVAHAGTYYNYGSLGVSLNGMDALPAQRRSLKILLKWLLQTYNLPPAAIKGHKEVAAKQDPQHIDMDALRRELAAMQPVSDPIVIDASGNRENSLPGLPGGLGAVQSAQPPRSYSGSSILTFSAGAYDETRLEQAIANFLANEFPRSPMRGYEKKIVKEAKNNNVNPAFFLGNSAQGSRLGEAYVGQYARRQIPGVHTNSGQGELILDAFGQPQDKLEYFHNIVDYTPDGVNLYKFDSWDVMIEFWFSYIRDDYFSGQRFGRVLDTLDKMQPIYCPPCVSDNRWVTNTAYYMNQFQAYYEQAY